MSVSPADLFAGIMPFVATVEGRSLTRAARLLGVTPSMVSRSIAKLESDLGIRLLNRTPRTVSATPEGSIFYGEWYSCTRHTFASQFVMGGARPDDRSQPVATSR
jgi:hypothetical protein